MKWIIIVLAVLNFGYMVVDGSRALVSGNAQFVLLKPLR